MKILLRRSALCVAALASAQLYALEEITEQELSEVTGQAFISVDASQDGTFEFSRINLGLVVETLLNVDQLILGEKTRAADDDRTGDGTVRMVGENGNTASGGRYDLNNDGVYDADIIIENFGLGRVNNYLDADNASITPFLIENPYIELAYNNVGGVKRMAGVRIGFERSKGDLSGDLISLSGRVAGQIRGENVDAKLGIFTLPVNFVTDFDLLDGTTVNGTRNLGEGADAFANATYLKRASWLGVADGTVIPVEALGLDVAALLGDVTADQCVSSLGELNTCFSARTYQSIYIGDDSVNTGDAKTDLANGGAQGFFISLQSENVAWENLTAAGGRVQTEPGAYLNIDSYLDSNGNTVFPINMSFAEAERGLGRVATCVGQLKGC